MKKSLALLVSFLLSYSLFAQTYTDLVLESSTAIEQKDYVKAEMYLKAAMKKEPDNPGNVMLLTNLGTVQRYLKEYDEALVSYNAVLAKYPENVTLLHSRASLYCELEKWDQALLDYNQIVTVDKNNYEGYSRRALVYVNEDKLLLASADYTKMNELNPQRIDGKMGWALIQKKKKNWKDAEEIYTDLIYHNRSNADIYVNRAECYINMRKFGSAKLDIEKAIELKYSNQSYLYFLRGEMRMKQYDYPSALMDFEKAKEMGFDSAIVDDYIKIIKKK